MKTDKERRAFLIKAAKEFSIKELGQVAVMGIINLCADVEELEAKLKTRDAMLDALKDRLPDEAAPMPDGFWDDAEFKRGPNYEAKTKQLQEEVYEEKHKKYLDRRFEAIAKEGAMMANVKCSLWEKGESKEAKNDTNKKESDI